MAIFHPVDTFIDESDYGSAHSDNLSPEYYGAVGDGTTDDAAAFQTAVDTVGVAVIPEGSYYLSTLPELSASGQGLVGAGAGRTILILGGAGIRRDSAAALLENCRIEGITIQAATAALTTVGQQSYVNATAIDLTGMSRSVVRDVYVYRFATALKLDYLDASHRTYYNHIENFRSWGGATGIYVGGSASPRDGANANKFFGCEILAAATAINIRGAFNSFVGTRIECPAQTSGYPATAVGIKFDSGYYGISNTFIDTYCELAGTGNKGIHFYSTGLSGAWCTPNRWIGGVFVVNSTYETPTFDAALAAQVYGQHFDVGGLVPTRRLAYTPDGTLIQESYPDGGGILQTDAAGSTVYSAT